jgi:hypothetical protein
MIRFQVLEMGGKTNTFSNWFAIDFLFCVSMLFAEHKHNTKKFIKHKTQFFIFLLANSKNTEEKRGKFDEKFFFFKETFFWFSLFVTFFNWKLSFLLLKWMEFSIESVLKWLIDVSSNFYCLKEN